MPCPSSPGRGHGPFDHRPAKPAAAHRRGDPDGLDLRSQHAVPAQAGHQGELQRPGDLTVFLGDDEPVSRVGFQLSERRQVRVVIGPGFTFRADLVIGEQRDDDRHVLPPRVPESQHLSILGGTFRRHP